MNRFCLLALGLCATLLVATPTPSQALAQAEPILPPAVLVVMDISGSMSDTDAAGRIKLNGAKQSITALLDGLNGKGIPVGLRAYPAGTGDCGPGALVAPFTQNFGEVGLRARELSADGGTPTAEALTAAADDLRRAEFTNGVIVLVSDGESTCDNPCEVAEVISRSGIDVRVDTVGFDISDSGAGELQCIADATGGDYRDVADADELERSLRELTAATLAVDVTINPPNPVLTSVGRGTNDKITVSATIRNTSANDATRARVRITPTSTRQPFIVQPNRDLGNLAANSGSLNGPIVWEFTPPLDFEDIDLTFDVTASAINAPPVTEQVTVNLRGQISLDDAGPILQGRENVVIMGDSYSAGEGAGNYTTNTATDVDTDSVQNSCHRSYDTYGKDLYPQRTILACSGAVTDDFWSSQNPGNQPAQLDMLRDVQTAPDMVILTVGGNDVGFANVLKNCALLFDCHESRAVTTTPRCRRIVEENDVTDEVQRDAAALRDEFDGSPEAGFVAARIPMYVETTDCFESTGKWADVVIRDTVEMVPDLVDVYQAVDRILNQDEWIEERGGEIAPILVLAYPNPVPDDERYGEVLRLCRDLISYDEWVWASGELIPALNGAVEQAVAYADDRGVPVRYVGEVEQAFAPNHTICDEDRYLNELSLDTALDKLSATVGTSPLRYLWLLAPGIGDDLFYESGGSPAVERRSSEAFHPNANGYRAFTAAIVEWSLTEAAMEPVNRSVPAPREGTLPVSDSPREALESFNELFAGRPRPTLSTANTTLRIPQMLNLAPDSIDGTAVPLLIRNSPTVIEVPGLAPGAPFAAQLRSRSTTVSNTVVDDDGVARFALHVPASFPPGEHTLTVSSYTTDGRFIVESIALDVGDGPPRWERASLIAALSGAAVALVLALIALVGLQVRRRRPTAA